MSTGTHARPKTRILDAEGKVIEPTEHRVRFGGQVAIDEQDFPPPKAKIRGTFEAETGAYDLAPQKKGWVAVITLDVKTLHIEEVTARSDDQPELPGVGENDEGE